jgi:hypothetical protein
MISGGNDSGCTFFPEIFFPNNYSSFKQVWLVIRLKTVLAYLPIRRFSLSIINMPLHLKRVSHATFLLLFFWKPFSP